MDSLADLINTIKYFFNPPNRYPRDNPKNEDSANSCDNGDSEQDADSNYICYIIPGSVNYIWFLDLDKDKDHENIYSAYADENHDLSNINIKN